MSGTVAVEIHTFNKQKLPRLCEHLASVDSDLRQVLDSYGYPPMWKRPPGFETLIHIILEQQVSLASARAALQKLREHTHTITPAKILQLSDEQFRLCYFSRQKTVYARDLALAIIHKKLDLVSIGRETDDKVRASLKTIRGIGDWTVDIYLLMALQRTDVFPTGDLAMIKSMKEVKGLPHDCSIENILSIAEGWKPYRSIATMIFWHHYLSKRRPAKTAG